MSLGACTRCKKAEATRQSDVVSTDVFCEPCWKAYLAEFETMHRIRLPREPLPDHHKVRGLSPPTIGYWEDVWNNGEPTPRPLENISPEIQAVAADMKKGKARGPATTWVRPHYFDLAAASPHDIHLQMAIGQGYVPSTCLLGGGPVMSEMNEGRDPCAGCEGPRERCGGRPRVRSA